MMDGTIDADKVGKMGVATEGAGVEMVPNDDDPALKEIQEALEGNRVGSTVQA